LRSFRGDLCFATQRPIETARLIGMWLFAPSEDSGPHSVSRELGYDPLWVETVRRTLFADIVAISLFGNAFALSSTLI
jgi:hypothetical protein